MYVYGRVRELGTLDSIPFPKVQFQELDQGELASPVVTNARGRYEFNLFAGNAYRVTFGAEGYVSRSVEIDLRNTPPGFWSGGMSMNIDMILFKKLPGFDFSLLKLPVGKARYDSTRASITWDVEYTEEMQGRIDSLLKV